MGASMRLHFPLVFISLSAGMFAVAQTPPTAAPASQPTCADLHLIPAPRECVSVAMIPIGGVGFFVAAGGAEDSFAAEDLTEQMLGKRLVQSDAPFIRLERADSAAA